MPRTARLNYPGGVFHLVSRFAREEWWLDHDGARHAYLAALEKAAGRTDAELIAYCLMSSHVHLVVVQGQAPLERLTKSVNTAFATWVRHTRNLRSLGPVFAGRPRSVLVERDTHLLELVRYVHNNPVRAHTVSRALSSGWSSHQAYVGHAEAPAWLRMGYVLQRFGRDRRRATAAFDAFVNAGSHLARRPEWSGEAIPERVATARGELGDGFRLSDGILGSDTFVARVRADAGRVQAALAARGSERRAGPVGRPSLREVIDATLTWLRLESIELSARPSSRRCVQAKRLATWMWIHEYGGQQIDVARALQLSTTSVSRYYGEAIRAAGEFDEQASAVTTLLHGTRRSRPRTITEATIDALAVRYHVDVDES